MKYRVGTKVKIRTDLIAGVYDGVNFTTLMNKLLGQIVTITTVCDGYYRIKEDIYVVSDKMIEGRVFTFDADYNEQWASATKVIKNKEKNMKELNIADIKIIVPNKVVEVLFTDALKEKMVCHEDDTFDLRNCLFIALAKHMYKSEYTLEGIEYKANELKLMKKYVKIVESALKEYKKKEEAAIKALKAEAEEKASIERKKAKLAKYKAKRKEKRRQERITEQMEAYVNAMLMYDDIICGCEDCNCTLERNCDSACYDDDLK